MVVMAVGTAAWQNGCGTWSIIASSTVRKAVHMDINAFYASVEQRDIPELRIKPVIVAWRGNRPEACPLSCRE
jgi:hypothetical protein